MCRDTTKRVVLACVCLGGRAGEAMKMPLRRRISKQYSTLCFEMHWMWEPERPRPRSLLLSTVRDTPTAAGTPPGPPRHATVQVSRRSTLTCARACGSELSAWEACPCHQMASPLIITPLGGQTDVHYARYPTILSPGHGDIPLIRSASALGCKLSLKVAGSEQTSNMNVSTQLYGV